jgi:hypothetical protein
MAAAISTAVRDRNCPTPRSRPTTPLSGIEEGACVEDGSVAGVGSVTVTTLYGDPDGLAASAG